jgi:hypothetical protein
MRGIQYAAASRFIIGVSGILDRPPEPVIGLAEGETRWRALTVEVSRDRAHQIHFRIPAA